MMAVARRKTLMPGWESTPVVEPDVPAPRGKRAPDPDRAVAPDRVNRPAPIVIDRDEPLAHTRIRALQLAEWHGLISLYIGPINAAEVNPSDLRYWYLPLGVTLASLGRKEPPFLEAGEVLQHCYMLAVAAGNAEAINDLRYRHGLPW